CELSMSVRYRALLPEDIPSLVARVAAHPILGPRYGTSIDDFGTAVARTLGRNYEIACAFDEVDESGARLLGAGLAGFVKAEISQRSEDHVWIVGWTRACETHRAWGGPPPVRPRSSRRQFEAGVEPVGVAHRDPSE